MTTKKATLHFSDGAAVQLTRDCVIGRTPQAAPAVTGGSADPIVRTDDPQMSRQHAQIALGDVEATVTDLGSGNGTVVDRAGQRHQLVALEPFVVQHDDIVHFGQTNAQFTSNVYISSVATQIVSTQAQAAPAAPPAPAPVRPAAAPAAPSPVPPRPAPPTPAVAASSPFSAAASAPRQAASSPFPGQSPSSSPAPSSPFGPASGPARAAASSGARTAQPATFFNRLGGYLLDCVLYGLAGLAGVLLAVLLGAVIHPILGILVGLAVYVGLIVLYVKALGQTGQTWGRKLAGLKVVGERTGQPLGVGGAVVRCLVAGIASGSFFALGYLWMLWDDKQQTWHDKIANSVVIKL